MGVVQTGEQRLQREVDVEVPQRVRSPSADVRVRIAEKAGQRRHSAIVSELSEAVRRPHSLVRIDCAEPTDDHGERTPVPEHAQ